MFVIGGFNRLDDPFKENTYLGYFRNNQLVGLATYFSRFKSISINAQDTAIIYEFVDSYISMKLSIEAVPMFKCYAAPTVERLKHHGMIPKKTNDEIVLLLTKEDFIEHPSTDIFPASPHDVDQIIHLDRLANGDDEKEITETERNRIFPDDFYIAKHNGQIVSQANIHGYSQHYAQIGCVGTHPEFRGQGYAKRTVSALCKYWIDQGKSMILFCNKENAPALQVYKALGFKPFDEFIIAEY